MRVTLPLFGARRDQRMQDQQDAADHDAGVGHVEVGPVVVDDVDLEEVDDGPGADAVVGIADCAAEDQREPEGGRSDAPPHAHEHDGYDEAIISSNEVPKGIFITSNHVLNFIYEKGADGKWTRLNRADFMAAQ